MGLHGLELLVLLPGSLVLLVLPLCLQGFLRPGQ